MQGRRPITDHGELVSKHFRQYPVLSIDFKVNWLVSVSKGVILIGSRMFMEPHTELLILLDAMVLEIFGSLCNPYSDLVDDNFCNELRGPGALEPRRSNALKILTQELWRVYQKRVVVLIDKYDSPMHSAIEHSHATLVRSVIAATSRYSRPTISLLQYLVRF